MITKQNSLAGTDTSVSAGLTDIQLVEKINELKQDKKRVSNDLNDSLRNLAQRLVDKDILQLEVGDQLVLISAKLLYDIDASKLDGIRNCATDDQIVSVFKQLPNRRQLKELSDIAGASARSLIMASKRKLDTGKFVVKFKKRRKKFR